MSIRTIKVYHKTALSFWPLLLKILAEESTAVGISEKLFTPDGLFSLLASNEDERKALVSSPLYKKAQKCFRDLQFKEAGEFRNATTNLQKTPMGKEYAVKIERSKAS